MPSKTHKKGVKREKPARPVYKASGTVPLPEPDKAPITCQIMADPQTTGEILAWAHIGRVASIAGSIEQLLDDTIWTLSKLDHELGACITSQLGSNYNRFIVIESLLKLHVIDDKFMIELNKLANKLKGLGEKRNRSIHDPVVWNSDDACMSVFRTYTRPQVGLIFEMKPIDLDQYHKTGNELSEFWAQFIDFRERLFSELPTFD